MRKLLTILFSLPLFSEAQTVLHTLNFEDPSKLSEWTKILDSYPGHSFKLDSTIKRSGIASGRFETDITDNATNTANYHSTFNLFPETDSTRWYGFSEYFPSPYLRDSASEIHFQMHHVQDAGDSVAAPPISVIVQNDSIKLNILYSSVQLQKPSNTTQLTYYLGPVTRDVWTDFVFHIKFSSASNGIMEVWRNGVQLVNYTGPNCYKDTTLPYLVFGIYKFSWAVAGNGSTVSQRVVYYDDVKQADAGASYATVAPQPVKIPLDYRRFYQENSPVDGNLAPMVDGNTSTGVALGFSQILNPSYIFYNFDTTQSVMVYKIRWWGSFPDDDTHPLNIFGIQPGSFTKDSITSIKLTGTTLGAWNEYVLPTPMPLKTLVLYKWYFGGNHKLPTEFELWGTYNTAWTTPALTQLPKKTLRSIYGNNIYQWDIVQNAKDPSVCDKPYAPKMNILTNYKKERVFLDWHWIEPDSALYTFAPTKEGQFYLDTAFYALNAAGVDVCVCLKIPPNWMVSSWSSNTGENIECHGYDDISLPSSYRDYGRAVAALTRRYGANTSPPGNYTVQSGQPYAGQPVNQVRYGLGTVKAIMVGNETDRYWRGIVAYRKGREYAAQLSVAYDSIKAIDPTMLVVMSGTANAKPDYLRGMIDWFKQYRGGQLPFDIVDYHQYSNNGGGQQYGSATDGEAPEIGIMSQDFDAMNWNVQTFAQGKPIWISETAGFDINTNSDQDAIKIAGKSIKETQGDWDIRTELLMWSKGADGVFQYETFDNNPGNYSRYATMGKADVRLNWRPTLDYTHQMLELVGDWTYDTLLSASPYIIRAKSGSNFRYIIWLGSKTNAVQSYNVSALIPGTYTKIHRLTPGQGSSPITFLASTTPVTITETPIVIESANASQTYTAPTVNAGTDITITSPTATITTSATASGGTGLTYRWKQIGGPSVFRILHPNALASEIDQLASGVYQFQLQACNDNGMVAYDTLQVTVSPQLPNQAPVAIITNDAGSNQFITTRNNFAWLKGSTSTDADGSIAKYHWSFVSGPAGDYNIENPDAWETRFDNMMTPGYYTYKLEVVDDKGATGTATKTIIILNPDGSLPPVPVFQLTIKRRLKLN